MGYVSQNRSNQLNHEKTVYEEVAEGQDNFQIGSTTMNTHAYLALVCFKKKTKLKIAEGMRKGGEDTRREIGA